MPTSSLSFASPERTGHLAYVCSLTFLGLRTTGKIAQGLFRKNVSFPRRWYARTRLTFVKLTNSDLQRFFESCLHKWPHNKFTLNNCGCLFISHRPKLLFCLAFFIIALFIAGVSISPVFGLVAGAVMFVYGAVLFFAVCMGRMEKRCSGGGVNRSLPGGPQAPGAHVAGPAWECANPMACATSRTAGLFSRMSSKSNPVGSPFGGLAGAGSQGVRSVESSPPAAPSAPINDRPVERRNAGGEYPTHEAGGHEPLSNEMRIAPAVSSASAFHPPADNIYPFTIRCDPEPANRQPYLRVVK